MDLDLRSLLVRLSPPLDTQDKPYTPSHPHTTVSVALALKSAELLPTKTVKLPFSTTYSMLLFHSPRSPTFRGILTSVDCPALMNTFSNPLSWILGTATEVTKSLTYTCTTSAPSRVPLLVTDTVAMIVSSAETVVEESVTLPYANVV